jgi:hypothetical protein
MILLSIGAHQSKNEGYPSYKKNEGYLNLASIKIAQPYYD